MVRGWLTPLVALAVSGCGRALMELDDCPRDDCTLATPSGDTVTPTSLVSDAGTPAAPACLDGRTESCSTTCGSPSTRTCLDGLWTDCAPPSSEQRCDDGLDDDCDGRVDHHDPECTPIVERCEDTTGHGCNGDLGYGDHCAPADNTGGCTADRFWAWCNRRNSELPDIWDAWIRDWVTDRCTSSLDLDGATYTCTTGDNVRYECTTPLVLAFRGERVRFTPGGAAFDLVPGRVAMHDWPTPTTPWLAVDRDGDGRITDGSELLGSSTVLRGGRRAVNGFDALAELDDSGDGLVSGADGSWSRLLVWRDVDGDRVSQLSELERADAAGLEAVEVMPVVRLACDARGNCERERARFWYRTSTAIQRGSVIDVYLRTTVSVSLARR